MPRGTSKFAAAGFEICLLLLAALFALVNLPSGSPAPLGPDAPADVFSAARARTELVRLLGDETPHPVGSDANHRVEARLVERLTELGLTPEIQDTSVCHAVRPTCGRVRNVLARIDGEQRAAVLLMAHYDSVSHAPGAGDDGAGVATLLEIARVLVGAPHLRNSVVFAFTDGEEAGLLGAEAFFAQHAWAADVAAVINLEGHGSSGPSLLFRSGPDSGVVLDAYRAVARYPMAQSFVEELFKRMPNDTDLSVANRFGKPGVDFAFTTEVNHYHTPNDSIANLSSATLQHHGDNALPLARALANADLTVRKPNYVYATLTRSLWLAYSPTTGLVIALVVVVLLALATWRRWQGPAHFSLAFAIVGLTLLLTIVLELIALALADRLAGTRVAWPANPWPWRLIVYSVPVIALALQRPLVRRVGFWNSLLAAWWLWALLTLAITWWLPLASHLFLPAAIVAAIVIVVLAFSHPLDRPEFRTGAAIINALCAAFLLLPLAYNGEVSQGLALAPTVYVPLALIAVTLLPLVDRGRVRYARWATSLVALAGVAWTYWVPLYSPSAPQHLNFTYALDADAKQARWLAWSPNPLPKDVAAALPFVKEPSPLPWQQLELAVAPADAIERPAAEVVQRTHVGATRTIHLRVGTATAQLGLAIPADAPIAALRIDGHTVALAPPRDGYRLVRFSAPPLDGITLEVDSSVATISAYLIDSSDALPESARSLTGARGRLAVPVGHDADRWLVYRRIEL